MAHELVKSTLACLGKFVLYIIPCVIVLLAVYKFSNVPKYVFRKLLHLVAFTCVTVMILVAECWQAAVLASVVIIVVVYPILSWLESKSWFAGLFVQKSKGEIKRSLIMLFAMFALLTAVAWGIFNKPYACAAAILMWGTGDAAAALIGIPFGKHKVISKFTDGKKSYEGSFAMFIVSTMCGFFFLLLYCQFNIGTVAVASLTAGIAGAFIELISPSEYDTITVPSVILAILLLIV